ncbi:cytochrome BD ubiquinol oxidase subunit II [Cupriavidus sp. USMAA2-4]|uniref:cytochrome d ubiquinol oxidase subunit II n=1 Tax=unclassified Cupriavidus TaxID=2640874 RepID=UPI0008A712B0|nr:MULTISPECIES: cytochrome d ubiquinol oxidase subunit II [unclassified Cupriavidus]AOY94705.1 cytochrome BD ubiquinol oxidase subunit II [Cupriavidus sp. USMAA2-4]AOZ02431.1 cytochrome BD ubiquinol oxidase subunit II [Cupriavidus sp. USMAHM13]
MTDLSQASGWMPVVFLALMGLSMLIYVILDGYDLGVGVLLRRADDAEKDAMIASIGPFWDANETWLVLGVGLLLTAFPLAHGVILTNLYLPVALMLAGLILRGVAFDFRVKARAHHKPWWNAAFYAGSLLAGFSQGLMLGLYITGFRYDLPNLLFAVVVGLCLVAGYCLLGAGWLVMKSSGRLQRRAVYWARRSLWLTAVGVSAVSVVTPLVSERIFDKWFSLPNLILLAPVPLVTVALFVIVDRLLRRMPALLDAGNERWCWVPFAATAAIFLMAFNGLAYSLFPFLVVDRIDIWQAASAPESLGVILVGAAVVLPTILGYTVYAYRVFWGKATDLHYY